MDSHSRSGRALVVGRDEELHTMQRALSDAHDGRGQMILLVGDAGAGKTELARRISTEAEQRGFLVAWGRGWEGGGAPAFWPWIQMVRKIAAEVGVEDLLTQIGSAAPYIAQLVPELGPGLTETAPALGRHERDRFIIFDAAATLLKTTSGERPLLLVFDDLHAADESTLHLLHFIVREIEHSRVLILGTYIEGEAKPIAHLLQGLAREGRVLPLRGLNEQSVAELYEVKTGHSPPDGVLSALLEATEGNPFFLDEAIRLMASRGDLRRPDYSLGFRVPRGARGVIDRRLMPLPDEVVWLLSQAAVIGREFDASILAEVAEMEMSSVFTILEHAAEAGIITEVGSQGTYSFAHILVREALYEELTPSDRMRLHDHVAQAIEKRSGADLASHASELAHHYFKAAQAGDKTKALRFSLLAADRAYAATAYEEAVRLYGRALKIAESTGMKSARREQVREQLEAARSHLEDSTPQTAAPSLETQGRFLRQGDYWEIDFEGTRFRLRDSNGLRYLSQLLKNPGREIHALEIVSIVQQVFPARSRTEPGLEKVGAAGDAGAILDATAKDAYKRRLNDLNEELEEADEYNDQERVSRIRLEIDALVQQLAGAVGLGGRDRKAASQAEKARLSVTKGIRNTLTKVEANHPSLGTHLQATVRTGTYCSYKPDPRSPISWQV
ncbi:MAG: BREX system ATP-binding domain-containing protein [Actinomycetota bacterium]